MLTVPHLPTILDGNCFHHLVTNYEGKDKGILEMLALTWLSQWSHWSNGRSHLDFSVCNFKKCPSCLSHSLLGFLLFAAESILIDTIINVSQTHIPHNVISCVAKKKPCVLNYVLEIPCSAVLNVHFNCRIPWRLSFTLGIFKWGTQYVVCFIITLTMLTSLCIVSMDTCKTLC